METIKSKLIQRLQIAFKEQGIDSDTKQIIYASYGVKSSTKMSYDQLRECICKVGGGGASMPTPQPSPRRATTSDDTAARKCRSVILSILARHGIKEDTTRPTAYLRFAEINDFVDRHTNGRKLYQMSYEELYRFQIQLRAMESHGWRMPSVPAPTVPTPPVAATVVIVPTMPTSNNTVN